MGGSYKCYSCRYFEIHEENGILCRVCCELGKDICDYGCERFDDLFEGAFDNVEDNNISDDMEIPF